jgi:hypothetical protein
MNAIVLLKREEEQATFPHGKLTHYRGLIANNPQRMTSSLSNDLYYSAKGQWGAFDHGDDSMPFAVS